MSTWFNEFMIKINELLPVCRQRSQGKIQTAQTVNQTLSAAHQRIERQKDVYAYHYRP